MIYTIERDNKNVTARPDWSWRNAIGEAAFSSVEQLQTLTKDWPAAELVELWNALPGDAKPVKKFMDRWTAITRIWTRINMTLHAGPTPDAAPPAAQDAPAALESANMATMNKASKKAGKPAKKKSKAPAADNKRELVIAMISAKGGATLDAIMEATGWQRHTVRGFVSILASKHGYVIDSTKGEDGARTYTRRKG